MIIGRADIKQFNELAQEKEVICFGAGKYFDIFFSYCPELITKVKFIVDNNPEKWNTFRNFSNTKIKIISSEKLSEILNDKSILLVTVGNNLILQILKQLENMDFLSNREVFGSTFILNELETWNLLFKKTLPNNLKLTKEPLIPKKIHYCWVGGNPIPKKYQEYIDGWKRLCPDYEIIRWDESNYDIEKNQYMKQAYEQKKWGFVSDYMRKDIIYKYGGIYLDTDVEMIKCLDDLLYQNGFCGVEPLRGCRGVNLGLGFGARKGLPIIKELRDVYEGESFSFVRNSRFMKIGPDFEIEVLLRHGLKLNYEYQIIADMTIYPLEVLSGTTFYNDESFITKNTYTVHHYSNTWKDKVQIEDEETCREIYKSFVQRRKL